MGSIEKLTYFNLITTCKLRPPCHQRGAPDSHFIEFGLLIIVIQVFIYSSFLAYETAHNLLVEEHYIRLPYFVWRKSEYPDATVVCFVPLQLIVIPHLKKDRSYSTACITKHQEL
jgi:hypothetical protein